MYSRYTFGSYPYSDDRENITWLVLEKTGNKAKLISEHVLDANSFDRAGNTVWENTSLREWLHDDFLNKAFTEEQQDALVEVMCECEQREGQEVIDTDYTFDKITLLSLEEVRKFFPTDDDRIAKATQYAQEEGAEIEYAADCCSWWLRSPGIKMMGLSSWNACVMANGTVKPWGVYTDSIGIRPVITVNLDLAASCQYDMIEEDEDPVAALEKLQELLEQLKALSRDDADEENSYADDEERPMTFKAVDESADEPTVLRTITGTHYVNDAVSISIPDDFVCEETLDKEGDTALHIKSGMYTDEEGDARWRLAAFVKDIEMPPDAQGVIRRGMSLIDQAIANVQSTNYIKLSGSTPAAFVVQKMPINLGGNIIKLYALSLLLPWAEGKYVLIGNTYTANSETDVPQESYRLFLELAKAVRINGQPLMLSKVSVEDMLRELIPSFEEDEKGSINLKIGVTVNGTDAGSITYNSDGSVTTEAPEELPEANPQGYLYSHYRQVGNTGSFGGFRVIVNANGTEFDPLSIERYLADNDAHELLGIVRNYKRNDPYSLDESARELAEVFRVDMDAFDSHHDRLAEIYASNLQKCYTFSALRSFAWTLGEMAALRT